jgi:hypothetical protein
MSVYRAGSEVGLSPIKSSVFFQIMPVGLVYRGPEGVDKIVATRALVGVFNSCSPFENSVT